MTLPFEHALVFAAVLFAVGLVGVIARRNVIMILLSVEIMLNAAGVVFIVAGSRWQQADGQILFLFILTTAAAEVLVGLALVLRHNHLSKTLDADAARSMKG
jgi:NADH-quinone oxidoreductase subunit K